MEFFPKLVALLLFALVSATVVTAQRTPQDIVDAHNAARAAVGVGPVSWDATVAAWAQSWVDQFSASCQPMHSPAGRPYGENIYWGSDVNLTGVDAVNSWVSEMQYYDHATNSCSAPAGKSCGHYTQVVWRDSTAIGCGSVLCDGGAGAIVICSYNPPGNWDGQSPY